ncbi:MAG: flavodoxin family protein [Frankiales bacterium]|nr:flavodoxin family protein [Frankiales bacterium]
MPVLLIVHHTPSPAMQALLEAARAGAALVSGADVVTRPALSASASDLLAADAVLLGTPANLGYMSGALKHFFDTVYYPCLEAKIGMPYGVYVHGQNDTTGAVNSIDKATTGMKWRLAAEPVLVVGEPTAANREAVTELAGTLAALIG